MIQRVRSGDEMSQILDQQIYEWGVFIDVLPLFALGSRKIWTPITQSTDASADDLEQVNDDNTLDSHNVSFEEKLKTISDDLEAMEGIKPLGLLPRSRFTSCEASLSSLLKAFEELVDADILDKRGNIDDVLQDTATNATYGSVLSTLSSLSTAFISSFLPYKSFSTTIRGANPEPPSPLPRVNSCDDENSRAAQYPKLDVLGSMVRQHENETDLSLLCRKFVRTGHTHTQVDEIKRRTKWLYKSLLDANPDSNLLRQADTIIKETMCHWDYRRPWDTSSQLFFLLSRNTCANGHLVRLQLDGRELNRREANGFVRFSVFISKCPHLLPSEEWWEGAFRSVPKRMDDDELFFVCDYITSRPSPEVKEVKSILFTPQFLLTPVNQRTSLSPFPDAYPTISLAELLERGVLDRGERGVFEKGDKAVLAFSIGLCLLHLIYSSWMHEEWTSKSILFLHKFRDKQNRTGPQIMNIHLPYISTSLYHNNLVKTPKPTTAVYRPHLLSFAQLLVEIETGLKQTNPIEDKLSDAARDIKKRGNAEFAEAIRGCIELTKPSSEPSIITQARSNGTSRSKRAVGLEITFSSLRKKIFQNVIRPLEINYTRSTVEENRYGPFDIPESATNAVQLPVTSANRDGSKPGNIFYFDDLVPPMANASAETHAKTFFDNFSTFRKHFIAPKMIDRRGGRRRLRIAVLDTGIDKEDAWLDEALSKVAKLREDQGFSGSEETNPFKRYWPSEGDVRDEVGHGTWIAYLLLKCAPDTDLYIAKVSKSMKFNDTDNVVNAFNWAVEQEVDIISMSFGSREHISALETAITNCKDQVIIFASASNYGLNESRTYPARDGRVICVHALDGLGGSDSINPATDAKASYGTLGLGVKLSWQGKAACHSGTSYATPILAAISATLLDWLHYHSENEKSTLSPAQYAYLKKTARIRELFETHLSKRREELHFVAPWILFESNCLSSIEDSVCSAKYVQEKDVTVIEAIRNKLPIIS
ncbi:hypothetical protein F4803DRAFT_198484 [Xylaria telfairii]|nr:hypothetical protein F4803DRAFT_198484 [Xylaria telfairii]